MQSICGIEQYGRARIVHSWYLGLRGNEVGARRAGYEITNEVFGARGECDWSLAKEPGDF